jgi:type II secretory pathway pseudopilin PulG
MSTRKVKAFGLIEAVFASTIVVLILSAAVALGASSSRSARFSSSYSEAQHIAELLTEQIKQAKTENKVYFDTAQRQVNIFSIDCFDTVLSKSDSSCQVAGDYIPYNSHTVYTGASGDYVVFDSSQLHNPSFKDGFFSWKMTLTKSTTSCQGIARAADKCRYIDIDVKWVESTGPKNYHLDEYITDWER